MPPAPPSSLSPSPPRAPSLIDDLDLIADMTADFARSRDIHETLRVGLERISTLLGAEAASVFLVEPESGDLVCRACRGPANVQGLRLAPGQGIVWRAVNRNETELVEDTRGDPDFAPEVDGDTGFVTRSVLCAPMSVRDERVGAIELFNKQGGGSFDHDDSRILQALAASAALAVINTRQADAMARQQALQRELALAADIQRAMLPAQRAPEFSIHGLNLPARGVSGDFFDIVALPDGRQAFAIADVSGKGMNAALLMAKTASLFRCLAKRLDGPGAVLAAIDAELAETSSAGMFVTMVAGVLDPARGVVTLANAGHEPPLLRRGDGFHAVDGGLPPLGIVPDLFAAGCPESVVDLDRGELYLFTDGLTEVGANGAAMLGADGVARLLAAHLARPAPDRLRAVADQVEAQFGPPKDDLTLMVVADPRALPDLWRQYPARPDSLAAIRHAVADTLGGLDVPTALAADLVLAVDEACQNVIRHAYAGRDGDLVVEVRHHADRLEFRLTDFALPVNPEVLRPRDVTQLRPGGLGTHLIHAVMDDVGFLAAPPGTGNLLRMTKRMGEP